MKILMIDYQKANKATALGLASQAHTLAYMREAVDFLMTHNKNYTKKQYYFIEDLQQIINAITEI